MSETISGSRASFFTFKLRHIIKLYVYAYNNECKIRFWLICFHWLLKLFAIEIVIETNVWWSYNYKINVQSKGSLVGSFFLIEADKKTSNVTSFWRLLKMTIFSINQGIKELRYVCTMKKKKKWREWMIGQCELWTMFVVSNQVAGTLNNSSPPPLNDKYRNLTSAQIHVHISLADYMYMNNSKYIPFHFL